MSAAAGVVLPMPISPVTRQRRTACHQLAGDLGADVERGLGLRRIVIAGRDGQVGRARCRPCAAAGRAARRATPATPTSTTSTRAPIWRASTLMAAPPAQKLATICAVTSCGHGVTPSATTPWSPAKTATAAGAGQRRRALAGDPAQLRAEGLEAPERAAGLRQAPVQRDGVGHGGPVERAQRGDGHSEGSGRCDQLVVHGRSPVGQRARDGRGTSESYGVGPPSDRVPARSPCYRRVSHGHAQPHPERRCLRRP